MKKLLLTICAFVALFLSSCSDPVAPTISFSEWYFNVPFTGGDITFSVTSNMPWELKAEEGDPITYSPKSGDAGTYEITASIPATDAFTTTKHNLTGTSNAETTFISFVVRITQDPKPALYLSQYKATAPKEGKLIEVLVSANDSWSSVCDTEGVVVYPSSNITGEYRVFITVPENTGTSSRLIDVAFSIPAMTEHLLIIQD
ncbi:MAG: BACON domain-containing protein [Bacteroidales bacterium]|nr:BACON domain-containing protein [Bacteroidales bacterium]